MKWILCLCCALFVDLPAPSAGPPRQEEEEAPACRTCRSEGRLPCPEHKKADCELELDGTHYCSEVADDETCGGTGFVDCDKCTNPAAEKWLADRRATVERLREPMAFFDKEMGRRLRKAESDHFVLIWDVESLKIDRRRVQAHELVHIYLARLETLYADYLKAFGATDADFAEKSHVFVWWLPTDQHEASLRFCQSGSRNGVKLMGATPRFSVCGNKQNFRGDEELHRSLVHNVAHLLLSHQKPSQWIGQMKGGWADAGVAHWFEDLYWGLCTNYCYQEQNTNVDFKGGKFRPAVRKMVATDKAPSIGDVFSRNTDNLTLPEHAVAFSYVDYLLHLDGKRFSAMMRMLRRKLPTRDALKEQFDMNPLQFEERWKAWVLETYPTR